MCDVLGPLVGAAQGIDSQELQQLVESIARHGRRCVRPRPGLDLSTIPFATEPVPWCSAGRFLMDDGFRPGGSLHYAAGNYAIQDAASLLPISLMEIRPGQDVCDVCAAPGGKSAAILDQLQGKGLLLSNEVIASRVDTLQLALARTGWDNYVISNVGSERLAEVVAESFDCVLVDAPCTGQSMIARGKQSLSAFSNHQIAHSAARQQSILRSALQLVRPGGRLVYSTCTFAFDENEAIVAWLRETLPTWRPVMLDQLLPWQTPGVAGCYRLWPHRDRCAGGFAAALARPLDDMMLPHEKQEHNSTAIDLDERSDRLSPSARSGGRKPRFAAARVKGSSVAASVSSAQWSVWHDSVVMHQFGQIGEFDSVAQVGLESQTISGAQHSSEAQLSLAARAGEPTGSVPEFWQRRHRAYWFSPDVPAAWRGLAYAGIEVAGSFGEHWQPSYPLSVLGAKASAWFRPHHRVQLSDAEAVAYMSGSSLHRAGEPGWCIVCWSDRALGWGKQVGSQLKNHLPKPLRQPSLR